MKHLIQPRSGKCPAAWAACVALASVPVRADFLQSTGDLSGFLNGICNNLPGADSEAFDEPTAGQMASFRDALTRLLRRDYPGAAAVADEVGYDLVEFIDIFSDFQPYYVLVERTGSGFDGLGTYAFNPAARRRLSIQAPHVPSDGNTGPESIEVFLDLDAEFWQVNGTHRCANAAHSDCDGTTDSCGDHDMYHESDVAHFTRNFFQVANDTVAEVLPGMVTLQFHSFSPCSGEGDEVSPIAQLSMVSNARYAGSLATRLARSISEQAIIDGHTGRGAVSWNATDGESDFQATSANTCPGFNGGANVQGRSLHGSVEPCGTGVGIVPSPERFVHIEQRSLLTRAGPGLSRDTVIAAIAAQFPAAQQRWVKFDHFGLEFGSFIFPHSSLGEAVASASAGETIRVRSGNTNETGVFSKRVVLRGFDGTAVVGVQP